MIIAIESVSIVNPSEYQAFDQGTLFCLGVVFSVDRTLDVFLLPSRTAEDDDENGLSIMLYMTSAGRDRLELFRSLLYVEGNTIQSRLSVKDLNEYFDFDSLNQNVELRVEIDISKGENVAKISIADCHYAVSVLPSFLLSVRKFVGLT
jgi:hypothetical protein